MRKEDGQALRGRSSSRLTPVLLDVTTGKALAAKRGIHPDKVAQTIEHALIAARPRARYLVGLDAKVQARVKPLVPIRIGDAVVARVLASSSRERPASTYTG